MLICLEIFSIQMVLIIDFQTESSEEIYIRFLCHGMLLHFHISNEMKVFLVLFGNF